MKKGNLRTKKIYGKGGTRFVVEARTFGGLWRQTTLEGEVLIFETEAAAVDLIKLLTFFIKDSNPLKQSDVGPLTVR